MSFIEQMYTNISFLSTVYTERRSGLPLPPEDGSPRPLISMAIKVTGKEEAGFNWKLPIFGAIGFGIGFGIMQAITWTIVLVAQNSLADAFPGTGVDLFYPVSKGVVIGVFGGAALGLAFKDKAKAIYFALAGAVAFSVAFWFVISAIPDRTSDLGWFIMGLFGASGIYSSFEVSLAHGLGIGVCIGAIGGLGMGIASPRGKLLVSILLCLAGLIWFGNAYAFGDSIMEAGLDSPWNWMGGAIGGGIYGLTLAVYYWLEAKRRIHQLTVSRPEQNVIKSPD